MEASQLHKLLTALRSQLDVIAEEEVTGAKHPGDFARLLNTIGDDLGTALDCLIERKKTSRKKATSKKAVQ